MPAKRKPPPKTSSIRSIKKVKAALRSEGAERSQSPLEAEVSTKEDVAVTQVTTLGEYIQFIERYCDGDYVLFRGQNSDWPLLPKLCRLQLRVGDILETERQMLEEFKRLSKPHLNKVPATNWEWIALAQHHGLPTRLLDWSTNPLAALWFAVSQPCATAYGVVWIFFLEKNLFLTPNQLYETDPFEEKEAKVFQPEISTVRIQSQSGWFTTQQFQHGKNFVAFDRLPKYNRQLLKLTIPKSVFSPLRFQLDRLGVNRFALFQDLDGIASYVEWVHSVGNDEKEIADELIHRGGQGGLKTHKRDKC